MNFLIMKWARSLSVTKFLYFWPVLMIIGSILAGIFYIIGYQYGSAAYWCGVGILNFIVVFLIPRWG